jgi:hypothetical protein
MRSPQKETQARQGAWGSSQSVCHPTLKFLRSDGQGVSWGLGTATQPRRPMAVASYASCKFNARECTAKTDGQPNWPPPSRPCNVTVMCVASSSGTQSAFPGSSPWARKDSYCECILRKPDREVPPWRRRSEVPYANAERQPWHWGQPGFLWPCRAVHQRPHPQLYRRRTEAQQHGAPRCTGTIAALALAKAS